MQWEYVTICCGLLCLASASGLCWQYKEWRVATHSQHLTSHLSSYDQCKIYSKVTLGQVARSDELAISAEKKWYSYIRTVNCKLSAIHQVDGIHKINDPVLSCQ